MGSDGEYGGERSGGLGVGHSVLRDSPRKNVVRESNLLFNICIVFLYTTPTLI